MLIDRLLHVPNAQPPEPTDYEPRPTHPVVHVPYQVAAAWDQRVRAEVEAKKAAAVRRKQAQTRTQGDAHVAGRVPRELCHRAKKIPAVRTWVRSLEEPVRRYLVELEVANDDRLSAATDDDDDDTEDEEIVFVGRNGTMRDGWKRARREDNEEKGLMLDDLGGDDESGAFKYVVALCRALRYFLHHTLSPELSFLSGSAGERKIADNDIAHLQALDLSLHLGVLRPSVPLRPHGRPAAQGRLRGRQGHEDRLQTPAAGQPAPTALGALLTRSPLPFGVAFTPFVNMFQGRISILCSDFGNSYLSPRFT